MDAISTQFKGASILELREIIDAVAALCAEGRERASALYRVLPGESKKNKIQLENIIRSLSSTCEKCKGVIDMWTAEDDGWKSKVDVQNVAGWRSIFTGRKPPGYLGLPGSSIESTSAPRRTSAKKWVDPTGNPPVLQQPFYERETLWKWEQDMKANGEYSPRILARTPDDRPRSWTALRPSDPRSSTIVLPPLQYQSTSPATSGNNTPAAVHDSRFHSHTQPRTSLPPGVLVQNTPPTSNGFAPILPTQQTALPMGQDHGLFNSNGPLPRCDTCCKVYYGPQDAQVTGPESKCPECQEFEARRTICELCYEWTLNEQCHYDSHIEGHENEPICEDCIKKEQEQSRGRKELKKREQQKRRGVRGERQSSMTTPQKSSPHPS